MLVRAGDTGKDLFLELKKVFQCQKDLKMLIYYVSTREPYNYIQANQIGCQLITVPPSIIDKIEKFGKSF